MSLHESQPVVAAGTPLDEARAVAVMIHGRGAGPRNILDLVPVLDRPALAYLAPAAADQTWYPFSFMADTAKNEPYLSSALRRLATLVADVESRGIAASHIVLLGFSQGACLASEFAVRHAQRFGGLVAFSGGVIGPPGTVWNYPGSFDGMPAFFGCSDVDAHVPKTRVDESVAVFRRMGADVVERIYPGMGHTINDDEIARAQHVIDRVLQSSDGRR
jgi:phospholipase/carboxylesterase